MPALFLDHGAWEGMRHYWSSQREFLGARLRDGLHSIDTGGFPLDILMVRSDRLVPGGQRVLPVLFTDPAERSQGCAPYLHLPAWLDQTAMAALCISDPVLAMSPELKKGWFADGRSPEAARAIAGVLIGISERFGVEPLLLGGAAGGFAALRYGALLGRQVSVLAWNPHVKLDRGADPELTTYLSAALSVQHRDRELPVADAENALRVAGVPWFSAEELATRLPRRLVLVQQRLEPLPMRNGSGPLIASLAAQRVGPGRYIDASGSAVCLLGNWEQGSAGSSVPPVLGHLLELLVHGDVEPQGMGADMEPAAVSPDRFQAWDPLRFKHVVPAPQLLLDCHPADGQLLVDTKLQGQERGEQQPQFAFYVLSRGQRIQMRWYEAEPRAQFPIRHSFRPDQVTVFAMDDLGTVISLSREVHVQDDALPASPPSAFIFGSCVSRDIFSMTGEESWVAQYVARSSLASALYPEPAHVAGRLKKLESDWQQRMLEIDLTKRLPALLRKTDFTMFLLDLVDERFRVALADDVPVTVSSELLRAGFSTKGIRALAVEDESRMEMWRAGVERLLAMIDPKIIVLNRVYWANRDSSGELLEDQENIDRHNRALDRMYTELMERHAFRVIEYPRELLVADPQHRWGVSPFHYVPAMYSHALGRLRALAGVAPTACDWATADTKTTGATRLC